MPPWLALRSILLGIALAAGVATSQAPAEDVASRPNVLLIVSDDQRPDTLGLLNPNIQTPNLDALAAAGTLLTRAVSPNPICTPSRAEILTGCSGFRNGVLDFGVTIDPDLTTWPRAMHGAGYRTCYVGKWHNNGRPSTHGYDETEGLFAGGGGQWWVDQTDTNGRPVTGYRGWVFQSDDGKRKMPELGVGLTPDISAKLADAAIRYITRPGDKPFFLHVNFTAPHDPLLMPPGYQGRYDPKKLPLPANFLPEHPFDHGNFRGRDEQLFPWPRTPDVVRDELAVYYAVISHMDEQIGRVFKALKESGQWERTLVIFTSDHGLAIGSHGLRGKQNMYEHTVGVPCIVRGPGVPAARRLGAQVYLRDLYPTVCDLCSIPIPPSVEARSFRPLLEGRDEPIHPSVFCYFRDVQRMVRTDRWKLIYYPKLDRHQLFDLAQDPDERHDLAGDPQQAKVLAELQQTLRQQQQQARDPLLQL